MPDNGGQFRRSDELMINQVEGRLIATSGNWGRILAVAAQRGQGEEGFVPNAQIRPFACGSNPAALSERSPGSSVAIFAVRTETLW